MRPSLLAVQAQHGHRLKSGNSTVSDELREAAEAHKEAAAAIKDAALALKETAHSLKEGAEEVATVDEEQHALKAVIKTHIAQSSAELAKLEAAVLAPIKASEGSEGEAAAGSAPVAAIEQVPASKDEGELEPAGAPAAAEKHQKE